MPQGAADTRAADRHRAHGGTEHAGNTPPAPVPPLARAALDRDAPTRMDPERLAAALAEPAARFLLLSGERCPVFAGGERPRLAWLSAAALADLAERPGLAPAEEPVYLGRIEPGAEGAPGSGGAASPAAPCFAVFLGREAHELAPEAVPGAAWAAARELGADFDAIDAGAAVTALALARWHEAARFSPATGAETTVHHGGWMRRDVATGQEIFPRTDPAVIVLIHDGDRVLLGSNALWPSDRFSLLAGFVEAGESLESTVEREVFEESGLRVANIRYRSSQPWPFPRSLMLGFEAEPAPGVDPEALVADPEEIAELRWFTRAELLSEELPIILPGRTSIARSLLDDWLARGRQ